MKSVRLIGVILLIISGLIWVKQSFAWETDKLVDLNYFYIPDTELKREDGDIDMQSPQLTAMFPIGLSESVFLILGLDYQAIFVNYKDLSFSEVHDGETYTEEDLPDDFHAADPILGCIVSWTDRWATYAEFRPGVHSDMKELSSEDVYYQGGALVSYSFSDAFSLSAGAFYTDSFGEPELLPFLGVQWQIGDDFALDTLLPSYFLFGYQTADWLQVGLRARLSGHEFRLTERPPYENSVLKYEQILAGPCFDLFLSDLLVLRVEGGIATNREFEFRDEDSDEKLFDGKIKDSGYGSVSLSLQY